MSNWIDRVWTLEPGVPVIGSRTALTKTEKRILLAYAQGCDNSGVVERVELVDGTFKGTHLPQLRAKLHASAAPCLVKRAYEVGALELEYSREIPQGIADLMPRDLVQIWQLITEGLNNVEIGKELGVTEGSVRAKVLALGKGFSVARRVGGRTQLASRAFEFGLIDRAYWTRAKNGK